MRAQGLEAQDLTMDNETIVSFTPLKNHKNLIINGDFNIWQRGTTIFPIVSGEYTADRMKFLENTEAVLQALRSTDVPTVAESGHYSNYSYHADVTTSDGFMAAGQFVGPWYIIVGYDANRLFGNYATLSFWVKATVTGTHCVSFRNDVATDRSYIAEYTVNATNTWEKKEITVDFTTIASAGTWDHTNGYGLQLHWSMGCGSNYHTTPGAWQTGNYLATSNQVIDVASTANNFRLSQVQLEIGDTATSFEHRSFEEEFSLCQRYFQYFTYAFASYESAGNNCVAYTNWATDMRVAPTISGDTDAYYYAISNVLTTGTVFIAKPEGCACFRPAIASAHVQFSGYAEADAEL